MRTIYEKYFESGKETCYSRENRSIFEITNEETFGIGFTLLINKELGYHNGMYNEEIGTCDYYQDTLIFDFNFYFCFFKFNLRRYKTRQIK